MQIAIDRATWSRHGDFRSISVGVALCGLLVGSAAAQLEPASATTVIVVRHAEKADDGGSDPGLSAAGLRRAQALSVALAHVGVGAVITSQAQRTQATAAPLARSAAVKPVILTIKRGEMEAHIADVRTAVDVARRAQKGAILIVGHSNTVPIIVRELTGIDVEAMCESQYDRLYVFSIPALAVIGARGVRAPVPLMHVRYGDVSPAALPGCE